MKKIIITGLNGTLAPKLAKQLEEFNHTVIAWDRAVVEPENYNANESFIETVKPDAICHLATGSPQWCENLAKISFSKNIRLLFTSTAMVFNCEPNGPHRVNDPTTGRDDYGKNKIASENLILQHNPNAVIARIGWQIDWDSDGNNMFTHLKRTHEQNGKIEASENWYPATSFMTDTCKVLITLLKSDATNIYHLDSNRNDKFSFVELCKRISEVRNLHWNIEKNQNYQHDQRLFDDRIQMPDLTSYLR